MAKSIFIISPAFSPQGIEKHRKLCYNKVKSTKGSEHMTASKIIKIILFTLVYSINFSLALALWLCGFSGNIMIGILLIVLYRLSLWLSPLAVTVICWLPLNPKIPASKKLLLNLAHLAFCGVLFLTCFLLFGNWY